MDIEVEVYVDVDVDETGWYIPWTTALTPVLPMISASSIFAGETDTLNAPQEYARTTGLQAASGEIAVFLDDDTLADPYFLEYLLKAYDETGADAIGGRVELRWEAPRPHWLSENLLELLGHFVPANERIRLNKPTSVSSIPADGVITLPLPLEAIDYASTNAPDGFICFSSCSFSVFVYLCLAHQHTGRELLHLIEAFSFMTTNSQQATTPRQPEMSVPQLLLVGAIQDSRLSARVIKLAANNSAIHLSMTTPTREEMPLYLGAADALVLPHGDITSAGTLEMAMLALSYERIIVAPDLPRFRGMLPPRASLLYDPANQESFVQALRQAPTHSYHLNAKEATALDAATGWSQYAQRLIKIYRQVLQDERE